MKNSHHTCIIETLVNEHRNNDAANELSSSSSVKTAKYCAGLSTTETTAASLHSNLSRSNSLKHFEHNLVINNRLSTVNTDEDIAISDDDSNHFENHCTSTSTFDHLENDSIVLLPFTHQVGGHTKILLLNQNTLCKPLIPRELLFYLNIPHQLNGFVPRYKGVVEICHNNENKILNQTINHHSASIKHLSSTSTSVRSQSEIMSNYFGENKREFPVRLSTCNDRRLLETNQSGYSSRPNYQYFMLLENIVSNYHMPCVLDLKMGTRQHSDDASDEKRHRQMAKCAASTSASLGVRICGMQVYHKMSNDNYTLYQQDKYYGRRIKNETGLKNELKIYFKNRTNLIPPIISRLEKLRTNVMELLQNSTLRFFSTSLLIVTEGYIDLPRTETFTKHPFSDDEEDYDDDNCFDLEVDEYLMDEKNRINNNDIMVDYDDDDDDSSMDSLSDGSRKNSDCSTEISYLNTGCCNNCLQRLTPKQASMRVPKFDIRMIDFAHSSLKSTTTSDHGFILGLNNLIRLLNEILFDVI